MKIAPETINPLNLPSLPLANRKRLPNCSAIYFVLEDEEIIYIGQSSSLILRWLNHHKLAALKSRGTEIKVAWLECSDESTLLKIESTLIDYYEPQLNSRVSFQPKWQHGKTECVRIPTALKSQILEIARAIDSGKVDAKDLLELIK